MAFASLNLAGRYRPWREAGLHFLLRPEQAETSPSQDFVSDPPVALFQDTAPEAAISSASGQTPQQSSSHVSRETSNIDSQPRVAPQDIPQSATQSAEHPASPVLAEGEWPHPWDCYAKKLLPNPAFIWTYWELGQDMSGKASGHRRTILQKLLLGINLPSGSIGFWPAAAFHGDELLYDESLFLRGLAHSGACDVLCFGPELFGRLFPGEVYAPRPREAHGYTFHFLPPLRESIAEDREALKALLQRVRTALRIES